MLAAPDLPAGVAVDLAERLPELLGGRWRVTLAEEPLLAGRGGAEEILRSGHRARDAQDWDATICLTDVPLRDGARPLVAALDRRTRVGVVNVPALGAMRLRPRVRRAAAGLIDDLADEPPDGADRQHELRPAAAPAPARHETGPGDDPQVRYVAPAWLGHVRLLGGMVRANRPWRAFSGLSSAVVAAFGTGAYALLSTTIWQLSGRLGWLRLGAIMVCAVAAMVAWLIVGHGLWERPRRGMPVKDASLYNAATALTLAVAVLCGYAAMVVLLLGVAALLIEGGVFRENAGRGAGIGAYFALAWLGAAIGTVAGALGSKLENADEVRRAAFGHDQCRRGESAAGER